MDIIQSLIKNKGWNTVNIKTVSARNEEELFEDISLNNFDFGNIAISPDSLKEVSKDENTVVLEGYWIIVALASADINAKYEDTPVRTREDYLVKITITKVN